MSAMFLPSRRFRDSDSLPVPSANHPVWEVYDLQRTCRFNVKYWTTKLAGLESRDFWLELSLAITAPGSAITGFLLWKTKPWDTVWAALTAITALLGIAKPLLKFSKKVDKLQASVIGYRSIDSQLEELANDIRREDNYSDASVRTFKALERQYQKLDDAEPVAPLDEKLREKCFEQVKLELPDSNYHIPAGTRISKELKVETLRLSPPNKPPI